jgi:NADH-quinone oxidoreductase subunit N
LRLVKIIYFDEPAEAFDPVSGLGSKAIMILSGIVALLFIVGASPVITAADAAAKALLP